MYRRTIATVAGGLVVIGAAVILLRAPEATDGDTAQPSAPAPQTTVAAFAHDSVLVPRPGPRPDPPARLDVRPGAHRLLIGWGPRHINRPEPAAAAGYEVRWGAGNALEHGRLVAQPALQLDGLTPGTDYRIEVRTVDAFGQRSRPVSARGTPTTETSDPKRYALLERFDRAPMPDPARWRLAGAARCGRATGGDGGRRLVITAQCGQQPMVLRSRAPLRLRPPSQAPGGELGRFVVATDMPGQAGELLLDLVPGPVDLIGGPPSAVPAPAGPGRAQLDPSLPPGTIRVRILGRPAERDGNTATTTVQVLVPPGTPLLGVPVPTTQSAPPELGVSVRWEVVLRSDGVLVQRDGQTVGGGDVVPAWTEATALVGFVGGISQLRAAVDLIGLSGASTAPPPVVIPPNVDFARVVAQPGSPLRTSATGDRVAGTRGGQLRITLIPQYTPGRGAPAVQFTVDIGGREIPARPAIANQPMLAEVRYPVVADVPPDALVLNTNRAVLRIGVRSTEPNVSQPTQVLSADLELFGDGTAPPAAEAETETAPRTRPALAMPRARFLDASGKLIPPEHPTSRGRLVLEVAMDAGAGQRVAGELAGLAGVEISLDGRPIAGIPTTADGPGVGGRWNLAVNTTGLSAGGHTVAIKAIGVDPETSVAIGYAPFMVG